MSLGWVGISWIQFGKLCFVLFEDLGFSPCETSLQTCNSRALMQCVQCFVHHVEYAHGVLLLVLCLLVTCRALRRLPSSQALDSLSCSHVRSGLKTEPARTPRHSCGRMCSIKNDIRKCCGQAGIVILLHFRVLKVPRLWKHCRHAACHAFGSPARTTWAAQSTTPTNRHRKASVHPRRARLGLDFVDPPLGLLLSHHQRLGLAQLIKCEQVKWGQMWDWVGN